MKYYAVVDTNVLVSSLLTKKEDSPVVRVINAIRNDIIIPMYNDIILEEYSCVLRRERFGFDVNRIDELLSLMRRRGINCEGKEVSEYFPDPDDAVFYEVAMSRENAYLVTGNLKHFPQNGHVVSPADMMWIIDLGNKQPCVLNESAPPPYLPIPLSVIDAIIKEYRETINHW